MKAVVVAASATLPPRTVVDEWLAAELAGMGSPAGWVVTDLTMGDRAMLAHLRDAGARVAVYRARTRERYRDGELLDTRERKGRNVDHEIIADLSNAKVEAVVHLFVAPDAHAEDLEVLRTCARWYCVEIVEHVYRAEPEE